MGNKKAQGRLSARRAATFLAALGALVMSSGIALMVTATPANATQPDPNHKDWVCKYVGKPGVDERLKGGKNPIWVDTAATKSGDWFADGQERSYVILADAPKTPAPTIADCPTGDDENPPTVCPDDTARAGEVVPDDSSVEAFCNTEEQPLVASATATPNTPTCANNVPSYTKSGTNIESAWQESAAPAFGATITVTATAVSGAEFAGGSTTKAIEVTFPAAATGCSVVETPQTPPQTESTVVVSPPKAKAHTKTHAAAVTPTVVEAGLVSTSTNDLRGEQGLALMVAGMVMLVGAGGMGLRVRTSRN